MTMTRRCAAATAKLVSQLVVVACCCLIRGESFVLAPTSATISGGRSSSVIIDNECIEFPPPLGPIDRLQRAATFWSTAVIPIMASYYGLINQIKLQELFLAKPLDPQEIEEMWNEKHASGAARLAKTITELKGFYVKSAQIISSRQDLFPSQYTEALTGFTDNLDPMPASLVKAVIKNELLLPVLNETCFDDVFQEFDEEPLGAASVAQVHRAVLAKKYGSQEVAVKVQRPSIESKLMGDIANLKATAKALRDGNFNLPLDYYTVFSELEQQLGAEFDFIAEADAMERIYKSLITPSAVDRKTSTLRRRVPLVMPQPVKGLVSRRVLVMDYLKGVPLTRARDEMLKKGIDPESPEAKLFGRKMLSALTTVFGRTILETGFFHADPHPGNLFVMEDGQVGLVDFGQVKQISEHNRKTLCKVMIALDEHKSRMRNDDGSVVDAAQASAKLSDQDIELVGKLALELGVELKPNAPPIAAAAIGIWLFDSSFESLPGGYDVGELSPNSPIKELKSFPQDLVLVGRSTILIKALSNRLGIPWSLASEWAPIARTVVHSAQIVTADGSAVQVGARTRLRQVWSTFRQWVQGRAGSVGRKLPSPIRRIVAKWLLKWEEYKTRRTPTYNRP